MKTRVLSPKSEIRRPKEIRTPKPEARLLTRSQNSGLGFRASFGFRNSVFGILLTVLAFSLQPLAFAQSYSINWHTIDGGGGTSTNGQYSVSGTIGQADAGPTMTNGQYSMTGGFWALPQAVQTEGAPTLTIAPDPPGYATISWTPATGTNWVLQETLSLSSPSWSNSPSGTNNPVTVPATVLPAKFYRLLKP